jgi:hypothetical protein
MLMIVIICFHKCSTFYRPQIYIYEKCNGITVTPQLIAAHNTKSLKIHYYDIKHLHNSE